MFKIIQPEQTEQWDAFVSAHPRGSIFHTRAMVRTFRHTRGYEPLAIAAVDDAGQIRALLVAARIQTLPGWASQFASRSVFFAEPICDSTDDGQAALKQLLQYHDQEVGRRTLFAEVRAQWAPDAEQHVLETQEYQFQEYLNYLVPLTSDTDTLWNNLQKSCRQKIRRSLRRGVEVRLETDANAVDRLYGLLKISYGRSRVPLADVSLFQAAWRELRQGQVQIRTVYHDGRAVAAGIVLIDHRVMYAWYGGAERVKGIAPFDCLTWSEIEAAAEQGLTLYDFGGAGWPDENYGPREFKAKFGGRLVQYGRYRRVYSPWRVAAAKTAYSAARGILSPSTSSQ
ncbi:MAG: GNAT family N-acetyltransferase [Planctomycetales bacterium]|nr:GNAT family N-acetyltransferase [Planctomycetales bacterium]